VKHATEAVGNSKHEARPSMNHFEKLLEESCLNHAYIIKHKLRDYNLMKSFVAMGSLPRGTEVMEALIEDYAVPFPGEDAVMTVSRRSSPLEKHRALDPTQRAPSRSDQRWDTMKCTPG
jgi:hypothetical protein